jgi:hypothetical protein
MCCIVPNVTISLLCQQSTYIAEPTNPLNQRVGGKAKREKS